MKTKVLFLSATMLAASPVAAQDGWFYDLDENVLGEYQSGQWTGTAAYFDEGYSFGPQYQCRISTPGAVLIQARPHESAQMPSTWAFFRDESEQRPGLTINMVRLGRKRYQVTRMPWRLYGPMQRGEDVIVLTFDIPLLMVRRESDHPWLPFVFLTNELLESRYFELGYSYEEYTGGDDPEIVHRTKRISLEGFADVSKWCGRQLLHDRLDQEDVDELTR
ncbi:hypothetical protein [Alteraurantiacibacter aquimixticola]|uniref:Uncharacterized protein n=1 Tax=Alteraurantiacibacter aquimixticola TaxID=2489173 RepID=A0A4V4U9F2_9SPHN|nr:hypothetical protein [Alteraurantiacibacter aquimixticola]TIX51797.1 hypothetical protein E5222_04965 [Alteraurantiacibacter aquimixticola]